MSHNPVSTNQHSSGFELFQFTRRQAQRTRLIERLLHRYEPLPDLSHLTHLQSKGRTYAGLQEVPLNKITGGVNLQGDYDNQFRPLRKQLRESWANIFQLMQSGDCEPVTLYKIWDSYYVVDGHQRVSVARVTGQQFIEAQVWEYAAVKQPFFIMPASLPAHVGSEAPYCEECVNV